ncbi:hypothetical protein Tco_1484266 [Tanacetum coccineum]
MACSVPHTYDEIKSMVEKQIQEDRGRQLAIMNLGHQFDNAITAKDEMRKAYVECRDIPLVQRALIENFLKIEFELDQQMQNALFRKATKLEKQIRDKNKWLQDGGLHKNSYVHALSTPVAYNRCGTLKGSIQGNKSGSCRHGWKQPDCANCFWHVAIALAVHNEFPLAFHATIQPDVYHKLIEVDPQR